MINRDKLLEEEHLDKTIESLLGKITEIIIAYKLRGQETEEEIYIRKISTRLEEFTKMYKNESKLFERDETTEDIQRKTLEIKIIEELGIIINLLNEYKVKAESMTEKIPHNQNINVEYNEIIRVHDKYMKES